MQMHTIQADRHKKGRGEGRKGWEEVGKGDFQMAPAGWGPKKIAEAMWDDTQTKKNIGI
jgi:hypothetical protein